MYNPRGRGRSPWRQTQDVGQLPDLRRPHAAATDVPGLDSSDADLGADILRKTELSPDAEEFYPKGYVYRPVEDGRANPPIYYAPTVPHWASGLALHLGSSYINCSWSPPNHNSVFKGPGPGRNASAQQSAVTTSPSQEPFNLAHLDDVMHSLTLNPGRFDAVIDPLAGKFGHSDIDDKTMNEIIDCIVMQSITEPNFRYNGARLCVSLQNASNHEMQRQFRNLLLCRCQEENAVVPMILTSSANRVHGYTLFLAELYIQMDIEVLGLGLLSTLNTLLGVPDADNIKCCCQALKLAGCALEKQDPASMNRLINTISTNILPQLNPESSVHFMVKNVIHLKQCGWGNSAPVQQADDNLNQQQSMNEPVFYGPDGQILTAEEHRFLQDNIPSQKEAEEYDEFGVNGESSVADEEEEDDGFDEAYEEFLRISDQTTKTYSVDQAV